MQRFPDLRGLQSRFWGLVSAPEGVAKQVAELHRAGVLESEDLSFLVRPDARLGPVERLDIYANMYFYRLRDCLTADFPKVAARVGAARFHNLVTDYLLAHPSTHFSLRELGRALPGFFRTHPLQREFPVLSDLAQLEWARVEVFDDADAAPLTREELLEAGGSAPDSFGVALVSSIRLLRVDASVLPLWKQLDGRGGAEEDGERKRRARREVRASASGARASPSSTVPCRTTKSAVSGRLRRGARPLPSSASSCSNSNLRMRRRGERHSV